MPLSWDSWKGHQLTDLGIDSISPLHKFPAQFLGKKKGRQKADLIRFESSRTLLSLRCHRQTFRQTRPKGRRRILPLGCNMTWCYQMATNESYKFFIYRDESIWKFATYHFVATQPKYSFQPELKKEFLTLSELMTASLASFSWRSLSVCLFPPSLSIIWRFHGKKHESGPLPVSASGPC